MYRSGGASFQTSINTILATLTSNRRQPSKAVAALTDHEGEQECSQSEDAPCNGDVARTQLHRQRQHYQAEGQEENHCSGRRNSPPSGSITFTELPAQNSGPRN